MAGRPPGAAGDEYAALVSGGVSYAGVDQGIDFTGPGQVRALDDAVITRVMGSGSGWPGQGAVLNYRLTGGSRSGQYVYVAEDFTPRPDLTPGKPVKKGEIIGLATGSGLAPGIEVGWARPSGIPLADRPPPRPADQRTPQGEDFRQYVASIGGGGVGLFGPGDIFGNPFGKGGIASKDSAIPGVGTAIKTGESAAGFLAGGWKEWVLRAAFLLLGTGIILMGLYLIVRALGAPSIGIADKVTTAVTRGAVKPSGAPRRKGDAAAARGEQVTRTDAPGRHTRGERRQLRANERGRQRAASDRAAAQDARYGGADDIPF